MTALAWAIVIALVLTLGTSRSLRRKLWRFQILLGDAIAIRKGAFARRWFRKRAHRLTGKAANKVVPWRKKRK